MAGETKVGLLAGLAFIICFAVILANRGRQEPISSHLLQLVDGHAAIQRSAEPQTHPSRPDQVVPDTRRDRHLPRRESSWGGRSELQRVDGESVGRANPTDVRGVAVRAPWQDRDGQATRASPGRPSEVPLEPAGQSELDGARLPLTQKTQDASARRAALQRRLDELDETLALQTRSNPEPVAVGAGADTGEQSADNPGPDESGRRHRPHGPKPAARDSSTAAQVRYTVLAGDTLSKIAEKHYRSRSRRIINAIFDANRSLLSSPDEIRVGTELVLPTIEGVGAPSGGTPSGRPATPRPADHPKRADPPDSRFRWYQIQKNDRYVSIAREQLGDESRWREIHELNKDKFPDPGRIREGVRIKLPMTKVAASGKGPR